VYKIDKDMQGTAVPANERKEYFCNVCGAEWSQLEVIDNASADGFRCHRCSNILVHDADRHSVGHQQSTRMNNQFKFITALLPQIDNVVIPDNTFENAFNKARPVVRDEANQVAQSVAVETGLDRPTAVKGLMNIGPKSMHVSISTADGLTDAEKAAERERKDRIAKQNALPSWMSASTINGESFTGDAKGTPAPVLPKDEVDSKNGVGKQLLDDQEQVNLDNYFAQLKAEQEAEAARKAAEEEEFESSDDDAGDFEDVVGTGATSRTNTPSSTNGAAVGAVPVAPSPLRQASAPLQSSLKREASGSGTSTGGGSPGAGTPGSDGRPAKKVKVEEPLPPPSAGDEGEDDDDLEFEDV